MVLEQVAFDIETTGFDVDDEVTVVGFALPIGVRVFAQTGGRPIDETAATVEDRLDVVATISMHRSEQALLAAVSEFVEERLRDDDVVVAAYNGETWNGGFDLPFLRTRFARVDMAWPFADTPYTDLLPVVQDLFNTTVDGEAVNDLPSVYEALCRGEAGALDPFEDSAAAIDAYEAGRFEALVEHNVSDILRARELGQVVERYCSKSDFNLKSLSPTQGR